MKHYSVGDLIYIKNKYSFIVEIKEGYYIIESIDYNEKSGQYTFYLDRKCAVGKNWIFADNFEVIVL
jgi:hypothetical protein